MCAPISAAPIGRRTVLAGAAAGAATGLALPAAAQAPSTGIDATRWSPDYVRSIVGTLDVDTAADCAKVVPLNHTGKVTYWYVGPNEASPRLDHDIDAQFFAAFSLTYPNITIEKQSFTYNDLLDKIRTAALGKSAPMVARLTLLWAPELAAKGFLEELRPEDVGYPTSEFWPGAMKSVMWKGKT